MLEHAPRGDKDGVSPRNTWSEALRRDGDQPIGHSVRTCAVPDAGLTIGQEVPTATKSRAAMFLSSDTSPDEGRRRQRHRTRENQHVPAAAQRRGVGRCRAAEGAGGSGHGELPATFALKQYRKIDPRPGS